MTNPKLSVVIVTLANQFDEIDCLKYLEEGTFDDYEVIIRTDRGISRARNKGIKAASSDKIVFLDDDAIPTPEYLEQATKSLDEHAIVAGRVTHTGSDILSDFADGYDQGDKAKITDQLVGCNMAFRREVFETVGYFDEEIKWGHDETELADRARKEYEIYYNPQMHVEHPYATSVRDYWRKMWNFGPADVYYGRKSDVATDGNGGVLQTLFGPSQYLHHSVKGTAVKSIGRLLRNISIAKSLLLERIR